MDTDSPGTSSGPCTRSSNQNPECPLFGQIRPLPTTTLPTKVDVILEYLRIQLESNSSSIDAICDKVADNLEMNWRQKFKLQITLTKPQIKRLIRDLYKPYDSRKKLIKQSYYFRQVHSITTAKNLKKGIETEESEEISAFKLNCQSLFDIAICKTSTIKGQIECECVFCSYMVLEDRIFLHYARHGLPAKTTSSVDKAAENFLESNVNRIEEIRKSLTEKTPKKRKLIGFKWKAEAPIKHMMPLTNLTILVPILRHLHHNRRLNPFLNQ